MGATTHFIEATTGNVFSPADVSATTGDTVQWDNVGGGLHNVVFDLGGFPGSGAASTAAWTYSETINTAGTYDYYCEIHGAAGGIGMAGTITVDP